MRYLSNKINILIVLSVAVLFGITGCDSGLTESNSPAPDNHKTVTARAQASQVELDNVNETAKELLAFIQEKGYDLSAANKMIKRLTPHTSDAQVYENGITAAINGDKFKCGPTPLDEWVSNNVGYASFTDALFIILNGINQYPLLYSLIFEQPRDPWQIYGYDGKYTRQVYRVSRSMQRFWDVNLRPVRTLSAKGSMLTDFDQVYALVSVLYPNFSDQSNKQFSQLIVDVVSNPFYNGGDAPVFSFNAFAVQKGPVLVGGKVKPPTIIMGDGILDGLDGIGLGRAAPQAILAHEMSHHVQYQLNVFDNIPTDLTEPEATRRTELMADAMAAYYLGHKRGAAYNWKLVKSIIMTDFNVGDCLFDNPGHHGTPQQRLRAGKFGFLLADNAPRRVGIMPASKFVDKFVAALPEILSDSGSLEDEVN